MRLDIGRRFLQMVWGDAEGWAFVARKKAPEIKGDPFKIEPAIRWPDDAGRVWAYLEEHGSDHGLFWIPVLRDSDDLSAGTGVRYRWLWAEQDRPTPAVLRAPGWKPWVVESGRPGHHHVYQRLAVDLTAQDWDATSRTLRDFMGAEVAQTDKRFVRVPGSMNRKEVLGRAKRVKIVQKGQPITLEPVTRAVTEHGCVRTDRRATSPQRVYEGRLPGGVRGMVDTGDPARAHRLLFKVGRKCAEAGMTADQVIELVDGSELHYAKLSSDPAYNLVRDMTRVVTR